MPDAIELAEHCCKILVSGQEGTELIERIPKVPQSILRASHGRVLRIYNQSWRRL